MKILLLVLFLQFVPFLISAQSVDSIQAPANGRFAKFPGGEKGMNKYLADKLKPAIKDAKNRNINGTVYIYFVIEKDGSVNLADVKKGIDPSLDAEVLNAVKTMPKWKPGKADRKPVRTQYMLPVRFDITENSNN